MEILISLKQPLKETNNQKQQKKKKRNFALTIASLLSKRVCLWARM